MKTFDKKQYRCSCCNDMRPEADCSFVQWESIDKDTRVGICGHCKKRMKEAKSKYVLTFLEATK